MKIFFSYPHDANAPLVERLKADLEARGHEVWFDADRIKEGDEWRARITRGILDSQRVVAFLSRHSVRDPGVCLNEIGIALAEKGDEAIVTVLVEPEKQVSAPLSVTHIQFMRMEDWAALHAQGGEQWEGWYRTRLDKLADVIENPRNLERDEQLDTLRRALVPQSFRADMARHLARFTGRRWMLDEYEQWLAHRPQSRVLRIEGGPGLGKTAIACYLGHAKSSVIGLVLCKYNDPSTRDPIAVVKTLAYQLATRLPDYRTRLLREPLLTAPPPTAPAQAREYAHTLFTGLISNLLIDQMERQRLVIVIDGLDEATEHGENGARNPIVQLMAREIENLPRWIGVVLTGRPDDEITGALARYRPFKLDGDDPRNGDDLRAYCEHWLARAAEAARLTAAERASLTQALLDRADGSFMYLVMAEEAAREDATFLSVPAQLPVGLTGLYRHFFERRFADAARLESRYKTEVRPLLELLLASPVALPMTLAREVLHWDDYTEQEVLARCGSLLLRVAGPEGETPQLTFFHQSVREWLGGRESAGVYMASPSRQAAPLAKAAWARYLASDKRSLYGFEALPALLATLSAAQLDTALGPASRETVLALAAAAEAQRAAMRYTQCLTLGTITVQMHENLLGLNNEDDTTQRDVSVSLNNLGDTLSTLGRPHEALPYYERSLQLCEALLQRAPDSGDAQRDVSVSLDGVGDALGTLGRPHEALPYYERSLQLCEALLRRAPDSSEAQRDVAASLHRVGDTLHTLGRPHEALPYYERSLQRCEALLQRAPDSGQAQRDVAGSLHKLGDALHTLGRPHEAQPYRERSLQLFEALLQRAPDSGHAQRDVAGSLNKLGDALHTLGRPHEAQPYHERSLQLCEALLQRAPDSGQAQRDVSVSLDRVGDTLGTLGRPHEAQPYHERSLQLCEALLQRAPDSGQAQRDVARSLARVGDTLGTLGRPHEAQPYYERSLKLCEALLQRAPNSGQAQRDVAVALHKLWSTSDEPSTERWGRLLLRQLLTMQGSGTHLDDAVRELLSQLSERYRPTFWRHLWRHLRPQLPSR